MSESHDTTESPSIEEEALDPRDAVALLTTTKEKAVHELELNTFVLCLLGGIVLPVGFGILWWSTRHQHPYQGPTVGAIGLFYLLVLIIDIGAITMYRRSYRGVGGPRSQRRKVHAAVSAVGFIGTFVVMGALDHAHVSHVVVYGIYPATMPLVVGGMIGAMGASIREDWTLFTASLAISAVAAGAAFGGPVGAWAISGFGGGAVLFAAAGFKLYQRRTR
jgi:peptidoglycan/LPS O-acetylase OafA/YrhL